MNYIPTKIVFGLLIIIFIQQFGYTQTDSLIYIHLNKTGINFKSFAIANEKIFAVNDSGKVVIWDLNILDTISFKQGDSKIKYTTVAKDRYNQIFLGTNSGLIYKINPNDLSFSLYLKIKYSIHSICFNSENKMFLIVPYAVYDPTSKKYWNKFTNHAGLLVRARKKIAGLFWKKTKAYFTMPQFTFLDNQDRWWMCSSFGEFGGEVQIFDTKNQKIYDNKFEGIDKALFFPKSVFEDNNRNIYITSGLSHFRNSGEIYKIDDKRNVAKIYDSNDYRDTTKRVIFDDNLVFIGSGIYKKSDHSIIYATSKGIFKADIPKIGKIQNVTLLFNPIIDWSNEPLAIGISMSIKQLELLDDEKILFLTKNNGFGLYDRKKLTFFK